MAETKMAEAAEALWGVVANASGGDWKKQSEEWQAAAVRARDVYHAALEAREKSTGSFDCEGC